MKTFSFVPILLLILACTDVNCGHLNFNTEYHSVYSYEVIVSTLEHGIPKKQFSITSQFDLHPTSKLTYDITLKNVESKELADSVDQKLVEELQKKFSVTIIKLPIGEFTEVAVKFSDPKESLNVKNLKRGLVALLNVDYRNDVAYKTRQSGLLGRCDNEYSVRKTSKIDYQSSVYITRTRLKNTCKASKRNEFISTDKIAPDLNTESKSDYYYELIESNDDVYIKQADLEERLSLRYDIFRNLTSPLISQQRVKLLSREKHSSDHHRRKREDRPPLRLLPTIPTLTDIFRGSKEAIENVIHKVIDGVTVTNLEADVDLKDNQHSVDEIATRFNRLVETWKVVEKEEVDKLQLGNQYVELRNYMATADKQHLLDVFKSDQIKADPEERRKVFFQILSLLSQHAAFQTAKEIVNNAEERIKHLAVEAMTTFFTSRTRKSKMNNEEANEVYGFCKEIRTIHPVLYLVPLYKACYLYFSRMASMSYLSGSLKLNEIEHFQKNLLTDLVVYGNKLEKNPLMLTLLALKSVKNFRIPSGLKFVYKVLSNTKLDHLARSDAAWGLTTFDVREIKDDLLKMLYNETESTEIRLAIFKALLRKHGDDLVPFVTRMKANFVRGTYSDDKQLVTLIHAALRRSAFQSSNDGDGEERKNARILYDSIKDDYREYLGYIPDGVYCRSYMNGKIHYALHTIKAKDSLLPETYYLSVGDSFDSSQYVLRSIGHGDITRFIFKEKSTSDVNDAIRESISKIFEQLQFSPKVNKDYSYLMSRSQNHYGIYFMFGDDVEFHPSDFAAFKGNGVHMKYSIFASSFTESGLPYFMISQQLSITSLVAKINGLRVVHSIGGHSKSIALTSIAKSHLVSGKIADATFRTNLRLSLNADAATRNRLKITAKFDTDETSTQVYYKSQRLINKLVSDNLASVNVDEADQFNSEDYEEAMKNSEAHEIRVRYPIGKRDQVVVNDDFTPNDFMTIRSMIFAKRYNHDVKISLKQHIPQRDLVLLLELERISVQSSAELTLSHGARKLHSLRLRRTFLVIPRMTKYAIEYKNFITSFHHGCNIDIQYPQQTFERFKEHEMLPFIKNATVTGNYYTGKFVVNEDGTIPDFTLNLLLSFTGNFSKRSDKHEMKDYEKRLNICQRRNDADCGSNLFAMVHKYNRLELNAKITNESQINFETIFCYLGHFLRGKIGPSRNCVWDKSSGSKTAQIELSIKNDLSRQPTVDLTLTSYYLKSLSFDNVQQRWWPSLFGYSIYEYNLDSAHKVPFVRQPICYLKKDSIQTYDGNKQRFTELKGCKPFLLTGDCTRNKFFVIRSKDATTVLHNQKHNITFTSNSVYVDGKQEDVTVNTTYIDDYPSIQIRYYSFAGYPCYTAQFGSGIRLTMFGTDILVETNPFYKNQLCGVCGNMDNNWNNDIVSPKNDPAVTNTFIDKWSFGEDEKCN